MISAGLDEAERSMVTLTLTVFTYIAHTAFPIMSFIAVVTGCIMGCHGLYSLIKDTIEKRKNK